jgi:hypothetical protein
MVALGLANSRLKDFYDIWILAQTYDFKDDRLARAIAATFARRKTEIPTERPDGLTSAFAGDPTKQQQWVALVEEVAVNPGPLVETLKRFSAKGRRFTEGHVLCELILREINRAPRSGVDRQRHHS